MTDKIGNVLINKHSHQGPNQNCAYLCAFPFLYESNSFLRYTALWLLQLSASQKCRLGDW